MKHYYAIGDLHGDFRPIRDFVQRYIPLSKETANGDDNIIICLGDFGGNYFFNYRDDNFKKKLGKYPFTYFVIRGNHEQRPSIIAKENPDAWHQEYYFENKVLVEDAYPYIKYALDEPTMYNIAGTRTLVLPGAYSIDKFYRLQNGWSWFEHEQMTEAEMERGRELIKECENSFDLVLSHTCPIIFEPTDLFLSNVDQSTVDKTTERFLGEVEYNIDYSLWLWGHYHADRIYPGTENGERIMLMHKVLRLDPFILNTGTWVAQFL